MKTVEISCDECGEDITTTGNSIDWRLAIINESIPPAGDYVTDMMIYPILNKDMHFCSYRCLKQWAINKFVEKEL